MQRHPALTATAVILLLGLVLMYPLLQQPIVPYDEGFVLERARRVMHGEVPHLDFWSIYPAGQYHLVALAYAWLGESATSARLVDAPARLLTAGVLAGGVSHATRKAWVGCTTGVLALLWLGGLGFPVYPGFTAMLCILGASSLWALAPYRAGKPATTIAAGLLLGVAAWFRHDMAGYAFAALVGAEMLLNRWGRRSTWVCVGWMAVGAALSALVGLAALLGDVPMATVIEQLLLQPASVMPAYRSTPWPAWSDGRQIGVNLVPVGVLLALLAAGTRSLRQAPMPVRRMHLGHALVALALLAQLSIRKDLIHAAPAWLSLLPSLVLSTVFLWPELKGRRTWGIVLAASLCTVALLVGARPAGKAVLSSARSLPQLKNTHCLGRAGCAGLTPEQQQLLTWLQSQPRDAGLFVGVTDHERFSVNEPIWYFLSGMGSPVFLDELHPGVANLRDMQLRTIEELKRRHVRFVLLTDSDCEAHNAGCSMPNLDLLDDHLRSHYIQKQRFGRYTVLEAKPITRENTWRETDPKS